ncbi:MAG: addiction module protein, partial [Candidatus Binatota bacterium]
NDMFYDDDMMYKVIMAKLAENIIKAAVKLPQKDRVRVVEQLLNTLEPEAEQDVDAAWAAEIERRSREIKEGTVRLLPWKTVRSRAWNR